LLDWSPIGLAKGENPVVVEVNGKQHGLVLLDTNVLSEFLLTPRDWGAFITERYLLNDFFPSYSAFTVVELYSRKELYDKYLETFCSFPSVVLEGFDTIFQKEVQAYNTNAKASPLMMAPYAVHASGLSPEERTRKLFEMARLPEKAAKWKQDARTILDDILSSRDSYPPQDRSYSEKEFTAFIIGLSEQQVALRDPEFTARTKEDSGEIDLSRFPSIVVTSMLVFYKFYADKRVPSNSDVFDLMIASVLPYVDHVITEASMCSMIRTIQRKHGLLGWVKAHSLSETRREMEG
jgi:hypothetical protein